MQIHEITRPQLREGVLGNIGRGFVSGLTGADIPQSQASIEKDAAAAAEKLQAQGYGKPPKELSVQDAVATVQKNPQQQQFIKGLVTQWRQQAPKAQPATTPVATTPQSKDASQQQMKTTGANPGTFTQSATGDQTAARDPNWRQDVLKKYGGVKFPQTEAKRSAKSSKGKSNWRQDALKSVGAAFEPAPAPRAKPGQMPASVAASKQGKLMLRAYGTPRGGIQDIDEAPQEYTTPGGIVVPGSTRTDAGRGATQTQSMPVSNAYQAEFEKWAAEKLLTRIPRVGTVTLDDLKKTDIRDELDRALAQVVATAGDLQKNAVAVNNYLTIAVAGVTRQSQKLRAEAGRGGQASAVPTASSAGGAVVTQQELRDKLMSPNEVGLDASQLDALKKLAQDPATRQALLKSWGLA